MTGSVPENAGSSAQSARCDAKRESISDSFVSPSDSNGDAARGRPETQRARVAHPDVGLEK
jgi:hypothetical protein